MSQEPPSLSSASTNKLGYMPQLDGVRAIAVLFVLYEHFLHPGFFPFGTVGVVLFYVLSGFLITQILIRYKEKAGADKGKVWQAVRKFYIRRTLRIFPLYYLLIFLLAVLPFYHVKQFWPYLVYGINFYFYGQNEWVEPYGHMWTVATEEQFYLLWPFLILFLSLTTLKRNIYLIIVGALVFRVLAFGYLNPHHQLIGLLSPSSFDAFGIGAWLAYVRMRENATYTLTDWKKWGVLFALFGIYLFNTLPYEPTSYGVFFPLCIALVSVWIIAKTSLGKTGLVGKILTWTPILFIGRISYGIYMWHVPAMDYYNQLILLGEAKGWHWIDGSSPLFPRFSQLWQFATVQTAITLLLSVASYYLLEQPLNRLKDKVA